MALIDNLRIECQSYWEKKFHKEFPNILNDIEEKVKNGKSYFVYMEKDIDKFERIVTILKGCKFTVFTNKDTITISLY